MDHIPDFHPAWFWTCSCGTSADLSFSSRETARLDHARHEHPHHVEPKHIPAFSTNDLGVIEWVCSCGTESYPRGHRLQHRAEQAHTRHKNRALLAWHDNQRTLRRRQIADADAYRARLARLSPEGRALATQRALEELL